MKVRSLGLVTLVLFDAEDVFCRSLCWCWRGEHVYVSIGKGDTVFHEFGSLNALDVRRSVDVERISQGLEFIHEIIASVVRSPSPSPSLSKLH